MAPRLVIPLLGLAVAMLLRSAAAQAEFACVGCEVQLGEGSTYHFWAKTGGEVFPVSINWSANRYELATFYFSSAQVVEEGPGNARHVANPYWGTSLSRRITWWAGGRLQPFAGFGLSYKSESDTLSVTRVNFASQLGLRWRLFDGNLAELAVRHWSNAGLKLPNHGQDFVTLTVKLRSHRFVDPAPDIRWILDPSSEYQAQASSVP